jgi:hypothetical protein
LSAAHGKLSAIAPNSGADFWHSQMDTAIDGFVISRQGGFDNADR